MFHVNVSVSAASDVPEIVRFNLGSQISLGLDIENNGNKWYLVVKNAQDYENPSQRNYGFSVRAGGELYDVWLYIRNKDDEYPYFLLTNSTSCEIKVSNALNKPHSIHVITD